MKELNIPAIAGAGCALAATVAYKNNDPVTASLCLTASVVAAAARFVQNCRGNDAVFCAPSCCKCITRPVCKLFSLGTSPLLTSAASLALPVVSSLSLTKTFSTILAPTVAGVHVEGAVRTVFDKTLPTCSSKLPKAISWMASSALAGTAGVVSSLYLGQLFSGEDESLLSELSASNSGLAAVAFSGLLLSTIMQLSSKTLSCLCKPRQDDEKVIKNDKSVENLVEDVSLPADGSNRPEQMAVVALEVSNNSGKPEALTLAGHAAAVVANPAVSDPVDPPKESLEIVRLDQLSGSAPQHDINDSELLALNEEHGSLGQSQLEQLSDGLLPAPASLAAAASGNNDDAVSTAVTDASSEDPKTTVELRPAVRRRSQSNVKPRSLAFDPNAAHNTTFTIEAEISHTAGLTSQSTVPESVDSSESTLIDSVVSTKPALFIEIPDSEAVSSAASSNKMPPLHPNPASGTPMVLAQKSPHSSSGSSSSSRESSPRSEQTTNSTAFPFAADPAIKGSAESLADASTEARAAQPLVNSQTSAPQPSHRSTGSLTPNGAVRTYLFGVPSRQSTGIYVDQAVISDVLARSRRASLSQLTGQLDAATEAAKSILGAAGGSKPVAPSSFTRSLSGLGLSAYTLNQAETSRIGSNASNTLAESTRADNGGFFSSAVSAVVSATMPYVKGARSVPSTPRGTSSFVTAPRRPSLADLVSEPGFMSVGRSVFSVTTDDTGKESSAQKAAEGGSNTPTSSQWVNALTPRGRKLSLYKASGSGQTTPARRASGDGFMPLPGLVSGSPFASILYGANRLAINSEAPAECGTPPLLDSREYTPGGSNAGTPMKQSNSNH